MRTYGIIGYPVEHSRSPEIHNAWFKEHREELGFDAEYKKFPVKPEDQELADFMKDFRENISGASVTIPHKEAIMKYLDEIDEAAEKIGAVNTIVNKDGRLVGYNTDVHGAMRALEEGLNGASMEGKKTILIGTGGAAKALAFGLQHADAFLIGVPRDQLSQLREIFAQENPDIIINATPVGMAGGEHEGESLVPRELFKPHMVVFDLVYTPLHTKLLQDAQAAGCTIITGDKMLLYQAEKQFELWTGRYPTS